MGIDIKVKKSQIAGNGVFANRKIKKGEAIFTLAGELCSLEEIIERVKKGLEEPSDPLGIGNEMYLDLDEIPRAFNHSCEPNAFISSKFLSLK
ncbi:SET domain-containing protein [Candidatus Uhrbacteria bacterium]|nr:SET domain-containing protein [Candidatus Uhrbacteria bacterium]